MYIHTHQIVEKKQLNSYSFKFHVLQSSCKRCYIIENIYILLEAVS